MPSTLGTLVEMLNKFSDRTPQLNEQACLNQIHTHAGQCIACARACPVDATITLGPTPQFDPTTCLACDACTAVCPTSALVGQRAPLEIWREAIRQIRGGEVSFVCRAVGAGPFAAVRIPCASALAQEFYIALALEGGQQIVVYTAECESCPLRASLEQARCAAVEARAFLAHLEIDLSVSYEIGAPPLAEVEAPPPSAVSRRGFLSSLLKPGASRSESDALGELVAAGVGWRRALLLTSLVRHGAADAEEVALPARPGGWAAYAVDASCVSCEMCAEFCPTGALASLVDEQDGSVTLWFSAARCTACGLCERVCFKRAIHMEDTVALSALMSSEFVPIWHGKPPANPLKTKMKRVVTT